MFYSVMLPKPLNKYHPSTALNPTAAKTLKRSAMPKYSGGATPVPMEPVSIIPNATAAHTAIPLVRLSLHPATIKIISDAMDKSTTATVTAMCMISWKETMSLPPSARGNIRYPTAETQFIAVKRYIPTRSSRDET